MVYKKETSKEANKVFFLGEAKEVQLDMLETGEISLIDLEPKQILELFVIYEGPYTEFDYRVSKRNLHFQSFLKEEKGEDNHNLRNKWRYA